MVTVSENVNVSVVAEAKIGAINSEELFPK